jgi:CheY-like chemotaxis protein
MPIFGNDLDFGWRAAAAGHRAVIVPQAVVFHVEAAHRGVRRTPLTGRHIHYPERRAALYTLLVNASTRSLPWRTLRLALGTLVRMIGLLAVRQAGQALDELAALVSLYGKPRLLLRARRDRRRRQRAAPVDVRPLLAPWWLPYRHGLDFLGDLLAAATNQAADVAERRRIASGKPVRALDDEDPWAVEQGWLARFFTNPVALAGMVFVVLALIGAREAFGTVAGGALSPAPETAAQWWRLYTESTHAFKIFLPLTPVHVQSAPTPHAESVTVPHGSESILVVEDEEAVRTCVCSILRAKGYKVVSASNGVEALSVWKEHGPTIDLLLTDMVMPEGLTGLDLAEKLLAERPDLKVIYTSGYSAELVVAQSTLRAGGRFLAKPYQSKLLMQTVREALDCQQTPELAN